MVSLRNYMVRWLFSRRGRARLWRCEEPSEAARGCYEPVSPQRLPKPKRLATRWETSAHCSRATRRPRSRPSRGHLVTLVRNPLFREWSHAAQPDGYPDRIEARLDMPPDEG